MFALVYRLGSALTRPLMLAVLVLGLWPGALLAAVVPFPDKSMSQDQAVGLPAEPEKAAESLDLLDKTIRAERQQGTKYKNEDRLLNNVLGTESSSTWLEQNRETEQAGDVNALDLMRAYVNVIRNNAQSNGRSPASPSRQSTNGKGFVMSLAEGLDDPQTLSLMTQVIQPYVENDMVTFSLLGFGHFMLVGDADTGNLAAINMANGRVLSLRSAAAAAETSQDPAFAQSRDDDVPLFPNDTETFGRILAFLIAMTTNPMTLISISCVFAVILLFKAAKKLS